MSNMGENCLRVLLSNLWSDKNIGDYLIVKGSLNLLREICPNLCPLGMTIFSDIRKENYKQDYEKYNSIFDGKVFPNYFKGNLQEFRDSEVLRKLYFFYHIAKLGACNALHLDYYKMSSGDEWSRLAPASLDLIISIGGQYLATIGRNPFSIISNTSIGYLAKIYQKPLVILGVTIDKPNSRLAYAFMKQLFKSSSEIFFRDKISLNIYDKYYKSKVNKEALVIPDLAFFNEIYPLKYPVNKFLISLTLRNTSLPGIEVELIKFIKLLINRDDFKFRVVSFGGGPSNNTLDNDYLYCEHFKRLLEEDKHIVVEELIKVIKSPEDIAEAYSGVYINITIRMHSAIACSLLGIPSVVIEYQGQKASGTLEQVGLRPFVVTNISGECLYKAFYDLHLNYSEVTRNMKDLIKTLRVNAKEKIAEKIRGLLQ
ncbi:MAG: polysaccharide pyruvyl transferase family protein [Conexivisphaerales archaeon]